MSRRKKSLSKSMKLSHVNPLDLHSVKKLYPGHDLRSALLLEEEFLTKKLSEEIQREQDQEFLEDCEMAATGRGSRCTTCHVFNPWVEAADLDGEYQCYSCRYEHERFKRQVS
jgi:hypothetical protein